MIINMNIEFKNFVHIFTEQMSTFINEYLTSQNDKKIMELKTE